MNEHNHPHFEDSPDEKRARAIEARTDEIYQEVMAYGEDFNELIAELMEGDEEARNNCFLFFVAVRDCWLNASFPASGKRIKAELSGHIETLCNTKASQEIAKQISDAAEMNITTNPETVSALLSLHGWGLRRHITGEIVVTHKDGSNVLVRRDAESTTEALFYRMMDNFLTAR